MVVHEDVGAVQEARHAKSICFISRFTGVHDARDGEGSPADQIGNPAYLVIDQLMPRHDPDGVGPGNAAQV